MCIGCVSVYWGLWLNLNWSVARCKKILGIHSSAQESRTSEKRRSMPCDPDQRTRYTAKASQVKPTHLLMSKDRDIYKDRYTMLTSTRCLCPDFCEYIFCCRWTRTLRRDKMDWSICMNSRLHLIHFHHLLPSHRGRLKEQWSSAVSSVRQTWLAPDVGLAF